MDLLIKVFSGVAIAGLSSWITVRLSLKRFRSEKWWEQKAQAYSNLLSAIHNAKASAEEHLEAMRQGKELPDEKEKELTVKSTVSKAEIYRAMDIGGFYFSQEAIDSLLQYKKESSNAGQDGSWVLYLTETIEATDQLLTAIIDIARNDLQITGNQNAFKIPLISQLIAENKVRRMRKIKVPLTLIIFNKLVSRPWLVIVFLLIFGSVSLAISIVNKNFAWFSSFGGVATIFGVLMTVSHTVPKTEDEISRFMSILFPEKRDGITSEVHPTSIEQIVEDDRALEANRIMKSESIGLLITVLGTLIWAYAGFIVWPIT